MDMQLYLAFLAATVVLALIPGPNVAVITASSVAYGARFGLLTVAGTSTAILVQLVLVGLGLSAALGTLGAWFEWIRWIGAGYLVYLGIAQWRAAALDLAAAAPLPRSARAIFGRGLLVALTNPKTLLFYGAFFPQFMTPGDAQTSQLLLLLAQLLGQGGRHGVRARLENGVERAVLQQQRRRSFGSDAFRAGDIV